MDSKECLQEWAKRAVFSAIRSGLGKIDNTSKFSVYTDEKVESLVEAIVEDGSEKIYQIMLPNDSLTIKAVDALCRLRWLQELDLSANDLNDKCVVLIGKYLKKLEGLNISENGKITTLQPLESLTNLSILDASFTAVSDVNIKWIEDSELRYLGLDHTPVSEDTLKKINKILDARNSDESDEEAKKEDQSFGVAMIDAREWSAPVKKDKSDVDSKECNHDAQRLLQSEMEEASICLEEIIDKKLNLNENELKRIKDHGQGSNDKFPPLLYTLEAREIQTLLEKEKPNEKVPDNLIKTQENRQCELIGICISNYGHCFDQSHLFRLETKCCIIQQKLNNLSTKIKVCCLHRFSEDLAKKVSELFKVYNKILENVEKELTNQEFISLSYRQGLINWWEKDFYMKTLSWPLGNPEQQNMCGSIHIKIIQGINKELEPKCRMNHETHLYVVKKNSVNKGRLFYMCTECEYPENFLGFLDD